MSLKHHCDDRDKDDPDHIFTTEIIAAQVTAIPIEATPDHNTGVDAATTGAAHDNLTPPIVATPIDLATKHHTDHLAGQAHIEALQVINPKITVGHIHNYPTDLQGMNYVDQVHRPVGQEENHIPRRT